jgi:hypothetical protein
MKHRMGNAFHGLAAVLAVTAACLVVTATGASARDGVGPASVGNAFALVNAVTGKCVEVAGRSTQAGASLVEADCRNNYTDPNQNWLPVPVPNSTRYQLRNLNSNLCMDRLVSTTVQPVVQAVCGTRLNQRLDVTASSTTPGLFLISTIPHELDVKCLGFENGSSANGTRAVMTPCSNNAGLRWRLS